MKFQPTAIPGAVVIDLERQHDGRGSFARFFCQDEFASQQLPANFVQGSLSHNASRGTLRGMHLQLGPIPEEKLVRCTRGRVYDVVLDLRRNSDTYKQWVAFELDAESGRAIFIPAGCAHGFLTLEPDTELHYLMTVRYDANHQHGARWNDPVFAIDWPFQPIVIGERDRNFPDYTNPLPEVGR
jgi:dTDP-4-dehydrorhamnose 3,5-epimerase